MRAASRSSAKGDLSKTGSKDRLQIMERLLAETMTERDQYFQEMYAEARQSYAYAQECCRLRHEVENLRRRLAEAQKV